jgi:hypothetical protein
VATSACVRAHTNVNGGWVGVGANRRDATNVTLSAQGDIEMTLVAARRSDPPPHQPPLTFASLAADA